MDNDKYHKGGFMILKFRDFLKEASPPRAAHGQIKDYHEFTENVPISWLRKLPGNKLRHDSDHVQGMSNDIKKNGINSPLIIMAGKDSRTAKLGEGNHRLAALHRAGYTHAPARVMVGSKWGSEHGEGSHDHDLIPKKGEYHRADDKPSNVFKSLKGVTESINEVLQIDRKRTTTFRLMAGKTQTHDQLIKKGFNKMSSKGDHTFYQRHDAKTEYDNPDSFIAHNHNTGRVEQHVDGLKNKAGTFHVARLSGAPGATIKAHDLYHHLIQKHNASFSTDKQSTGGRHVWNQLEKKRNVNVHGFDPKTKQGLNITSKDEEGYHDEKYKDSHDRNDLASKRVQLVASKK